jgi:predicted aspartyl protease
MTGISTVAAVLTAIICMVGGRAAAQEASKCQLQQIASIPVILRDNRPLVEVTVNGRKALMLIDTGAERSLLYVDKAIEYGLNPVGGGSSFAGVGGEAGSYDVTVARFGFGGAEVKNLLFYGLKIAAEPDTIGIFGLDLLGQADVELDIPDNAIRLFKSMNCHNANMAVWTKEPTFADMDPTGAEFHLEVKLNGVPVNAVLDSGAQVSFVTLEAATRVGSRPDATSSVGEASGIGEVKVDTRTTVFKSLAIGDEEIRNAKLRAGDLFRGKPETWIDMLRLTGNTTELLLGMDFIRSHRIYVATDQKRMFFSYVGGPIFQVTAGAAAH